MAAICDCFKVTKHINPISLFDFVFNNGNRIHNTVNRYAMNYQCDNHCNHKKINKYMRLPARYLYDQAANTRDDMDVITEIDCLINNRVWSNSCQYWSLMPGQCIKLLRTHW